MEGQTYNLDYPVVSEDMLISSAKLLREYHDVSENFIQSNSMQKDGWMFESRRPIQVICHNDFAPYNICYKENKAIGLIDFETAGPGPRIWDIAYALYRFAPFMVSTKHEYFGSIEKQIARAKLFCDIYGLKVEIAELIIKRLEVLIEFIIKSVKEREVKYICAIKDGHYRKYINDIEHIKLNKHIINKNLME